MGWLKVGFLQVIACVVVRFATTISVERRGLAAIKKDEPPVHRPLFIIGRIINRAAMGRARFMFYPWFIHFFLSVTRPRPPLCQISNDVTCDVYSPKAVETLIHGQCYGCCFLYCV